MNPAPIDPPIRSLNVVEIRLADGWARDDKQA
jgi:hypothetical protein